MAKKALIRLHQVGKTYGREIFAVFLLLIGIYFFRSQSRELSAIADHMHSADTGWVWAGVAVTGLYILLQGGMYVSSFAALGARLSGHLAVELFLKRNFISVFLPAGGISSLAYVPSGLRKRGIGSLQTHQASGIYAFVGIFTILLVGLPLIIYTLLQSRHFNHAGESLTLVFAILATLYAALVSFRRKGWLYRILEKHVPQFIPKLNELLGAKVSTHQFWLTTAYSIGVEVCGIVHVFIAAKALGLSVSFEASAIAYIISVLLMLVSPFLRGLGAVELAMVYILGIFRVAPLDALAITILYRLFEFWLPLVAGVVAFTWKGRHILARLFPAFLVFALGVVNLLSVVTPPIASRLRLLKGFIPVASINASNMLVLLIGIVLIVLSAFLIRGQRNAWVMAMTFSVISLLGHMFKALDYEEATLAASVVIVLAFSSGQYKLRTGMRQVQLGFITVAMVFAAVLLFGCIGFYHIEKKAFGFSFTWWQAATYSAKSFFLIYDDELQPATRFGKEFIRLTHTLGFFAWSFLVFVILKPLLGRKKHPQTAREQAQMILEKYGSSPVDYFKVYPDKLLFFSDVAEAFIAYRVANGFAVVLEAPVCTEEKKAVVLQEFEEHCYKMGLRTAFYRVDESYVSFFNGLKKRKMLIGQEAILELEKFTLEGRDKKSLRNGLNSLQKKGYTTIRYQAPLDAVLIAELRTVSDEWLLHYNRSEMIFSQGMFIEDEIQQHDVIAIRDAEGALKAFLNIIPDFAPGECTYDMIRKTADAPGGCMDGLIIELINVAKEAGYAYLNLGLVPMAGIHQPDNTAEQVVRYAYERLKRFRHYAGLREFKAKYASTWVNKYLIYENDFDLLQLPIAINKVMKPRVEKVTVA